MQVSSLNETFLASSSNVARVLGLPHLESHLPTVLLSFGFWNLVQYVISPFFLSDYAKKQANLGDGSRKPGSKPGPKSKPNSKLKKEPLNGWYTRVISMLHALVVIPLAFQCLNVPGLSGPRERAFGWDDQVGLLHGIACGFLWDILDAVLHFESIGFVLHGIACLTVFGFSYRPFLAYYGPRFLLWELSTPFLNLNWFFDRTPLKGTKLHLVNGIALLVSFFSARLIYGSYMSYNFYKTIVLNQSEIPTALFWTYTFGNILLNGLNWFWFSKMIGAVQRRFSAPAVSSKRAVKSDSSTLKVSPGSPNGANGTSRITRSSSRNGQTHNPRMRIV